MPFAPAPACNPGEDGIPMSAQPMYADAPTSQSCAVAGCGNRASVEVILYDVYQHGEVYFERDETCPYLCCDHMVENESQARGARMPRGHIDYPHTNRSGLRGFTIYRPLL